MARRRYVLRGVPGGWRIWDNTARRFWGELYEVCPDELVAELNGHAGFAAGLPWRSRLVAHGDERVTVPVGPGEALGIRLRT
jgi:hypothetical protein